MTGPLMPKATALWLIDHTTLTFEQISRFCQLHVLEVQGIADGDVAAGVAAESAWSAGRSKQSETSASAGPTRRSPRPNPILSVEDGPRRTVPA